MAQEWRAPCVSRIRGGDPLWVDPGPAGAIARTAFFGAPPGFRSLFARGIGGGGSAPALGAYTLTADPAGYALTASAAGLRAGRRLLADAAVYTLTGSAATLRAARRLQADPAAYTLTGANAQALSGRRLAAEAAAYALTGASVTLTVTGSQLVGFGSLLARGLGGGGAVGGVFSVAADGTSYVWTAAPALRDFAVTADGTSYVWTAAPALRDFAVTADGTSYVWTAAPALRDFAVTAEPTSYALGAQDVDLRAGRRVVAEAAAYVLTARDAGLLTDDQFAVIAEPAAYLLTGAPAGLRTGRRLTAPSLTYVFAPSSAQLRWGRLIGGARRTIKVNASRSRVRAQGGRRSTEVG